MDFFSETTLIAKLLRSNEITFSGLNFYSAPEDGIQVGTWGYSKDVILVPHNHNFLQKISERTCEVIVLLAGKLHVDLYTETDKLLNEFEMSEGDILVCLGGGHGYRSLSENVKVLEIKNGPYLGADLDRRRIESRCKLS